MQNGSLEENGDSSNHLNHQPLENGHTTPLTEQTLEIISNEQIQVALENDDRYGDNGNDAHPNKKRKLTDPPTRKAPGQRTISPPWKKIAVEGPTSFVEEGRRKSSRTNFVPIELQNQVGRRQTRGAIQHGSPITKSKYGGAYKSSKMTSSTSIQTQIHSNVKQPHLGRKPVARAPHKPSSKYSQTASAPSANDSDTPPPPKRSHKKKLRPPLSPQGSRSPQTPNTHQTRQVARTSEASTNPFGVQMPLRNGWHQTEEDLYKNVEEQAITAMSPTHRPQRLNLKVRMPTVSVQHPEHILPPRRYGSFQEWFNEVGRLGLSLEDSEPNLTEAEASREAHMRARIDNAAQPGGLLSKERCQIFRPEDFDPPPRQYTHQDRVVAHAIFFQKLMDQERRKHRRNAKDYAEKAVALVKEKEYRRVQEWKKTQPKSKEDIAQEKEEAAREFSEQLQQDVKQKWMMMVQKVEAYRLQKWQDEQERLGKEALNEVLEKSKDLLERRRARGNSAMENDDDSEPDDVDESEGSQLLSRSGSEGDIEADSNMSSSQSESEEDQAVGIDEDEGLTQDQLRQKYAGARSGDETPPRSADAHEKDVEKHTFDQSAGERHVEALASTEFEKAWLTTGTGDSNRSTAPAILDEVDDALMDNSDDSTDMDSEINENQGSSSIMEDDQSEDEEVPASLLGFFGSNVLKDIKQAPSDRHTEMLESESKELEEEAEEVSLVPDAAQGPTPSATTATTSEEPHSNDALILTPGDSSTSLEPLPDSGFVSKAIVDKREDRQTPPPMNFKSLIQEASLPTTPISTNLVKTPVPTLLRGTLREYQHYGLDWLAGLYAGHTNGILADEMGLGKTIQAIALLAHLALEHETWGPHLIVVPTSVMLNWEIEFKKFLPGFKVLTYYGTQEERKKKRQGWMDDDKWNVWITSYTLVTNDQQIFKRKAWHYMILDEAHNIKNFRSQRWQTLLSFNTKARLLLTGTPLQNNLTELWSLLYFLMPSDDGLGKFAELQEFIGWFKKPSEQILEHGSEKLDDEARAQISKLHKVLRPFLLRRLKADVEKQMPGKFEHVVYCRLSKRQRYLYDGFMSRAQTRETLASGNTFSIMNALMQLRKVCNHPDLFETRQIVTSFAMPKSAVADFEIKELLLRRKLLQDNPDSIVNLNVINLLPGANEKFSALDTIQRQRLGALCDLRQLSTRQWNRIDHNHSFHGSTIDSALASYEANARISRHEELRHAAYLTSLRSQRRSLYSDRLMEKLRFGVKSLPHKTPPRRRAEMSDWYSCASPALHEMVLTLPERSKAYATIVQKFACITPAVVATDMTPLILCPTGTEVVRSVVGVCGDDPFHEARMRLSIAFPDKRLLQYDCGKLQRLDALLRTLQAEGHRALIFTQMTKVLDILEQFLNIHGHRYLRLDGATKIEQRQILTDRFNNDNRILAFILSSRSGGIGINLTGADTVIFYDLDWNPAMDKQCQDRCHRIGQTRDVHIYRLVSEHTIEANILRKANQKRLLDDVVIQEGEFTTDYFNNMSVRDIVGDEAFDSNDADANAAVDRVLGARGSGRVFEAVEDQEDILAAKAAERELAQNQDATDFDEKGGAVSADAATPKTPGPPTPGGLMPPPRLSKGEAVDRVTTMEAAESGLAAPGSTLLPGYDEIEEVPSCDDYMFRFLEWELEDIPVQPPVDKSKKSKKGKEHGHRRR